jgi:hypothetical protein
VKKIIGKLHRPGFAKDYRSSDWEKTSLNTPAAIFKNPGQQAAEKQDRYHRERPKGVNQSLFSRRKPEIASSLRFPSPPGGLTGAGS